MWINSSLPPSNSFSYSGDNCWSIPGYPSLSFLDTSGNVLALHQRDGNTWTKASPHWTPWSTNGRSEEIILCHFFILCVATFMIVIIIFCCLLVFFPPPWNLWRVGDTSGRWDWMPKASLHGFAHKENTVPEGQDKVGRGPQQLGLVEGVSGLTGGLE